jgi:hypothetical protein
MVSKKRQGDDPGDSQAPGALQGSAKALEGLSREEKIMAGIGLRTSRGAEYLAGRRSFAMEMVDQGLLSSQKLAQEILFLLPDDFVTFYEALFHRALLVNDGSVMHGRSGGVDKAKGRTSMVTGSDNKLQSAGTGKKYKNTGMTIGNEQMMELKAWFDRELMALVRSARQRVRDQEPSRMDPHRTGGAGAAATGANETKVTGSSTTQNAGTLRCPGLRAEWVDKGDGTPRPKCGLFLKATWRFCPTCGYRLVPVASD